ncbi:MAG: thioredoxin fold domain-containing protein [Gammaproteobacteria bacterium]|nr:thioredoxin fold domain-containing protein [Gammaproteobacteria bacterium]
MKARIFKISALILVLFGGVMFYLQAGEKSDSNVKLPKVLGELPGYSFINRFDAAGGLQGVILEGTRGDIVVVYIAPDGEHVIAGTMLSPDGQNLSEQYAQIHAPVKDYSTQFEQLSHALTVPEGKGSKPIYVIYEPNCSFCKKLHTSSRKHLGEALFQWVPVAFLGTRPGETMPEATLKVIQSIIENDNPAQALAMSKTRSLKPSASISDKTRRQIDDNNKLMASFGISGTPAVIWKDSSGAIQVLKGLPPENKLAAMVKDLK